MVGCSHPRSNFAPTRLRVRVFDARVSTRRYEMILAFKVRTSIAGSFAELTENGEIHNKDASNFTS